MRLIDADALLEYLDKRRTYEVMDGHNKAYGKGVRDAMKDIENAPTIDAIPVEWLIDLANRGDFVYNAVARWQQKQEAQK